MANETPKPQLTEADLPEREWPAGMFPSPIVTEHFDPYTNLYDREVYMRAEGNPLRILGLTQLERMHDIGAARQEHTDHAESVRSLRESLGAVEGMQVKKPHHPPQK